MLEKELETLVLKERDVIPFLQKLTPKEKRELVPFLKRFKEKVFEHKEIKQKGVLGYSFHYEPTHTEKQRDLVSKAAFVCFNKTDAKRRLSVHDFIKEDYIEDIIPWYKPKWYSDLINEESPWGLSYEKLMFLYKKEFLQPSHALILASLPSAIVENKWENKKNKNYYKPEVLYKYQETLKEHIWFLFQEESGINNYYNYLHFENYSGGNDIWIDTFINLIMENRLDREKVLIATIYSSTKGFNKILSGWFFDLLIKLNPSKDEIISLQNEFFSALNSPHSKVINTVLKYFKLVANQSDFQYQIFIENASILLSSETKLVVNSTLMILDKIAKTHKGSNLSICEHTAQALINVDEKIQLRAAKIIEKYGDSKNQELLDELSLYTDNLFYSSNQILKEYISSSDEAEEIDYEVEEVKVLSQENKLPRLESLDDLIFFVSQSIDNNETYHLDLLLSYLPKLYVLLNKDNVARLEPVFKRSLDLSMTYELTGSIGYLELGLAHYINDIAAILIKKYPLELASFIKVKKLKIDKLKEDRYYSSRYQDNLKEIEVQAIPDYIYQVYRNLFLKSKSILKKGSTIDLLSTPTHEPCWIEPNILIDRVVSFEEMNEDIELYDFQIAMGRVPLLDYETQVFENIERIKNKEIKKVLYYHFDQLEIDKTKIIEPELWLQSVVSKNKDSDIRYFQEHFENSLQKELGFYKWSCTQRDHFYKEYDYVSKSNVQKKMVKKELRFENFDTQKKETVSFISSIKGMFSSKTKATQISSFYEDMHFKKHKYYRNIEPNDEVKFLFVSPNNPSAFLSHVINNNLRESTFFDETSKKNMVNLLKGLYSIWHKENFKETTYLFVATALLCSDRVARELAAELWIKANDNDDFNNELIGKILGGLQKDEYGPLKRFTDLLTSNLFNVSKKHNKFLYKLIENMIGNMNKVPIRGLKKLIEIFLELKYNFPQLKVSLECKENLIHWKETKSLITLINKIENN